MYAFIHIPKTAGTTLRFLFRQAFSGRHCDIKMPAHRRAENPWLEARDMRIVNMVYPNLAGICGHRVNCFTDLDERYPDIKYFTVLRDPLKRFISNFHHKYRGRMDECTPEALQAYAEDPAQRNIQTRWICGEEDAEKAIQMMETKIGMVMLTERFDESLLLLKHWLNAPEFEINYIARNLAHARAPLPYFDDPQLLKIIEDANAHDLEVYRYVVEKRFPQQLEAYGAGFEEDLKRFYARQQDFQPSSEPLWGKIKRNYLYKPMLHLPWA